MAKLTKWAVETAKATMNDAINKKLMAYDKAHPLKAKTFKPGELAEIAVKDPLWLAHVVRCAKKGYGDVGIRDYTFDRDSPACAAALKKNLALDKARDEARQKLRNELFERRDTILRTAVVGGYASTDLLREVNAFCR